MNRIVKILAWVLLLVTICGLLASCGKKTIVGNWISTDPDSSNVEMMTLKKDGTGTIDGISISWTLEDDEFTFRWLLGGETYECELDGDVLYLDEYKFIRKK